MQKIILGTTSPFRKEAFGFLGFDFVAQESEVAEGYEGRPEDPKELVLELAKRKTEAVAKNNSEGIVIGFDSVGWFEGEILEKPKSREEAFSRIQKMSGKSHEFFTGVHMINLDSGKVIYEVAETRVCLREIDDREINKYLDQDKDLFMKIALGYDPWGKYSASFVKRLEGSYNNYLRGIPLEVIIKMLRKIGYEIK